MEKPQGIQKFILKIRKIMKKWMEKIIKNEKGSGYLASVVICLILCMLISVGWQIYEITVIGNQIRNYLKDSVRYTVTKNWDDTFSGSRQGYTGAYYWKEGEFQERIDRNDIMNEFAERIGLEKEEEGYSKSRNDETQYWIGELQVKMKNTKFASDSEDRFEVNASMLVKMKIKFLNQDFPVEIPIRVKTAFSPLF